VIPRLPGWSWQVQQEGILLVAPGGPEAGAIRYTERVRPILSARALAASLPRRSGDVSPWSPPRRVVTDEGEYGVRFDREPDGGPYHRAVGVIYGDDFFALIDGESFADDGGELSATVDHLVAADAHLLGNRRRRFSYAPPDGWHGFLAGPFHAHWYPIDHPRDPSALTVPPAIPTHGRLDFATVLRSLVDVDVAPGYTTEPFSTERLSGRWCRFEAIGQDAPLCDVVILEDRRYAYAFALRSSPARHAASLQKLLRVVRSTEPIPGPRERAAESLSTWVD
jgi:hypothetical protein